jgi:hypothetical protein
MPIPHTRSPGRNRAGRRESSSRSSHAQPNGQHHGNGNGNGTHKKAAALLRRLRSNRASRKPRNPKVLQMFICYAREDEAIATAVHDALNGMLHQAVAKVFMDRVSLNYGEEFPRQLHDALEQANVLIVVFSGVSKPSVSYPGFEVGYFSRVMEHESNRNGRMRIIVPLYLEAPPAPIADRHGFGFGISKEDLQGDEEQFKESLKSVVTDRHPAVRFLKRLQDHIRDSGVDNEEFAQFIQERAKERVTQMLVAIFAHLKKTVADTRQRQKMVTIKLKPHSGQHLDDLPPDTWIEPEPDSGAMGIFGLPEIGVSWKAFTTQIGNAQMDGAHAEDSELAKLFALSWKDAIVTVVKSALPRLSHTDNKQVIVSHDGQNVYRMVVTTDKSHYDGRREFTLHFVEVHGSRENPLTKFTRLIRALDITCRFRGMFLEKESQFRPSVIKSAEHETLLKTARKLMKELNFMVRDAMAAGLATAQDWGEMVPASKIDEMTEVWTPLEKELRETCALIIGSAHKPDHPVDIGTSGQKLHKVLENLVKEIRPMNSDVIHRLTKCLQDILGGKQPGPWSGRKLRSSAAPEPKRRNARDKLQSRAEGNRHEKRKVQSQKKRAFTGNSRRRVKTKRKPDRGR